MSLFPLLKLNSFKNAFFFQECTLINPSPCCNQDYYLVNPYLVPTKQVTSCVGVLSVLHCSDSGGFILVKHKKHQRNGVL